MTVTELLKKYDPLIRATAINYTKYWNKGRHIGNVDDHISEARIAAWNAIKSYQTGKRTKIETYMVGCIKNRLIDIHRTANRQCRPELTFDAPTCDNDNEDNPLIGRIIDSVTTECKIDLHDKRIALSQILTQKEFETICFFLDGGGLDQLISARCRKTDEKRVTRMEIVKCLHHIRHKLKFHDVSLQG